MFAYPKQAAFNRPAPKNKIYGYAMDKAIPSLLFFELTFEDRVRFAAAYQELGRWNEPLESVI
jgi:hypothetical protein